MKKRFLLGTALAFFVIVGCKKVDEKTQFTMDYTQSVTVPSSTIVDIGLDLFTPDTETNSESTFEVNDTRKDKIEEITLTSLDLVVTSPGSSDFSFLKSINIYLNAEGLGEQEIAWHNAVPDGAGNTLTLSVSESDFKEFIKKDEFTLRVKTVTDEALTSDHTIDVKSEFFVDAKILGQ